MTVLQEEGQWSEADKSRIATRRPLRSAAGVRLQSPYHRPIDIGAADLLRSQSLVTTFSGVHRFHFATSASYWRWYLHPEGVHAR